MFVKDFFVCRNDIIIFELNDVVGYDFFDGDNVDGRVLRIFVSLDYSSLWSFYRFEVGYGLVMMLGFFGVYWIFVDFNYVFFWFVILCRFLLIY